MELTIPGAVAGAAIRFGDGTALAEPGGPRLGYSELGERVTTVAAALIDAGLAAGDRVAVWGPNDHHWVLAALGTLAAGGVLVPVSTRFTGPEALDVIGRSGARALFVAGDFLGVDRFGTLRAAAAGQGSGSGADGRPLDRLGLVVRIPGDWAAFERRADTVTTAQARRRAGAVRPGDLSDIMFTSGTTGRNKGAMTSHERTLAVARAWADCVGLGPDDRYLAVNSFFHTFGFKAGILACLVSGAALVPQAVFDAGQAMRLIEAARITVLPGAPAVYQMILDHPERGLRDLSSLRLAVTGAADVPVALVERMRRELSFEVVLTGYGLTEAVVATMCRPGDAAETVALTSGRAAAGIEVRIAGPGGGPARRARPGRSCSAGRTSCSATWTTPAPPGPPSTPAAGCTPETPAAWTPPGTWPSPAGSRTCTSAAASTCIPPRWSRCSPGWTGSRSRPSSACPTRGSARSARPTWSPARDRCWPRRTCWPSAGNGWPTTRCPGGWCSATPCPATRRARSSSGS